MQTLAQFFFSTLNLFTFVSDEYFMEYDYFTVSKLQVCYTYNMKEFHSIFFVDAIELQITNKYITKKL